MCEEETVSLDIDVFFLHEPKKVGSSGLCYIGADFKDSIIAGVIFENGQNKSHVCLNDLFMLPVPRTIRPGRGTCYIHPRHRNKYVKGIIVHLEITDSMEGAP